VDTLALRPLVHTAETYRVVVRLDGQEYEAIVKDVVFHPVEYTPLHVDFQALTKGEKITVTVPIRLEGNAPGVRTGGVLAQPLHELEIRCVPADIPGHVSVDVSALELGQALHVADLRLGDGVEVLTDPGLTVAAVTMPRVVEEVEPVEGEALPAEGAEETGEAAPAEE
jgi:large subunit ribosomal protein L25